MLIVLGLLSTEQAWAILLWNLLCLWTAIACIFLNVSPRMCAELVTKACSLLALGVVARSLLPPSPRWLVRSRDNVD